MIEWFIKLTWGVNPWVAVPLRGPDGDLILGTRLDYWTGRFPGYERVRGEDW